MTAASPRAWTTAAMIASLALTGGSVLSGCSSLPTAPPALPATFIPEVAAPTPSPGVPVGPDGFTVVERVALRVSVAGCDGYSNGSAWMLDEDTAVTNRHVVEGALSITLSGYDGRRYTALSSAISDDADLALVHITGTFPETATIADESPTPGDDIFVVGYPEGNRLTTTDGTYRGTVRETLETFPDRVDQLAAAIKPGNSGSPVVDDTGDVVGVAYAVDDANYAYAITLASLTQFLEDESEQLPNEPGCER